MMMRQAGQLSTTTAEARPGATSVLLAAAGLVGLASGSILAAAGYVVQQLTWVPASSSPYRLFGFTPWELGVPFEDVCIPADGGGTLRGWLLTRPASNRAIIGLAGYRGRRADLLGIGAALWRANYNVLLFDYRGHGESAGDRVTLGYTETIDFRAALRWLRQRLPEAWIGVIGYSMGGAVAIMGAAAEPAVRAVVTDCAFCRAEEMIRLAWRRRLHLPSTPVIEVASHLTSRLHGFRFSDVEPIRVVDQIAPRPLLLVHCTDDAIVPLADAYRLYTAAGEPKELWVVPNQPHCGAYFADRVAYTERIIGFFDRAAERETGAAGSCQPSAPVLIAES